MRKVSGMNGTLLILSLSLYYRSRRHMYNILMIQQRASYHPQHSSSLSLTLSLYMQIFRHKYIVMFLFIYTYLSNLNTYDLM
jgi:hypothetical protein